MRRPDNRLHVVIPAYNEGATVASVVRSVRSVFPEAAVTVINDGSNDDTSEQALAAGADVVDLPFNCGYGVALQTGLILAHRLSAQMVITLDADGQHDPAEARRLAEPVERGEADLCLGSRYLKGTARYRVPLLRRGGSYFFSLLVSMLMGRRITDPTTGFLCMGPVALGIYANLEDFPEKSPDADMILHAHLRRCRIVEVPVVMYEDAGHDSMHSGWKSLLYLPKMVVAMFGILAAGGGIQRRRRSHASPAN